MAEPTRNAIDRDELHDRAIAGGTFTAVEMRATLEALAAAEDAAGVDEIRRGVERLESIAAERDQLRARITAALALHVADPRRLGNTYCAGCGDDVPCATRQALEGKP